jgi:hypothetical protein
VGRLSLKRVATSNAGGGHRLRNGVFSVAAADTGVLVTTRKVESRLDATLLTATPAAQKVR